MHTSFHPSPRRVLSAAALLVAGAAAAQDAVLVRDINPGAGLSSPQGFTAFDGRLLFTASTPEAGRELWSTDGTESGTVLVRDIRPGATSSTPLFETALDGRMLFRADDGNFGLELWRTDGTMAGTVRLSDVQPGTGGDSYIRGVRTARHRTFFTGDSPDGKEFYLTDGTPAGTAGVDAGGLAFCDINATFNFVLGDRYYCQQDEQELFRTDGTPAGTGHLVTIPAGADAAGFADLAVIDDRAYFSAYTTTNGREPYVTDGTAAGTVPLRDIFPGVVDSDPSGFTRVDGRVFFTAKDDVAGRELWVTDGTPAGTLRVKDIRPGAADSNPFLIRDVGGIALFMADDGTHGHELWRSDGTAAGTTLVRDIRTGSTGASGFPIANANGRLLLLADDGVAGREFWESDGTAAGTKLIAQVVAGSGSAFAQQTPQFAFTNGKVVFSLQGAVASVEPHAVDLVAKSGPSWCAQPVQRVHDTDFADSVVRFPQAGTLADLDVTVDVDHSYVGDLRIALTHVDTGTTVELVDRPNGSTLGNCAGNHLDVRFDDEAAQVAQTACNATPTALAWPRNAAYRPKDALSAFDGQSAGGTWRLEVGDEASGDSGTFWNWCLRATLVPSAPEIFDDGFE